MARQQTAGAAATVAVLVLLCSSAHAFQGRRLLDDSKAVSLGRAVGLALLAAAAAAELGPRRRAGLRTSEPHLHSPAFLQNALEACSLSMLARELPEASAMLQVIQGEANMWCLPLPQRTPPLRLPPSHMFASLVACPSHRI